jgi:hypothetical protein
MRNVVIGLAVILLIITGVILFRGGSKQVSVSPVAKKPLALPEYANTTASVSWTEAGRVNGDDIHRQVRVIVSRDQRVIDIIQGYSGNVINTKQYYNTQNAYDVFLRALNTEKFLLAKKNVKNTDDRGQCPLGLRDIFQLEQDNKQLARLWSSTCSGVGTFAGKTADLQALFKRQIPDYDTMTRNVTL